MSRKARDFARLNPLALPPSARDQEIDDFLSNPICSRQEVDRPRTPSRATTPKLGQNRGYDWDSEIRRISSKYAQRRVKLPPQHRARGIPDIARREMIQESMARGIYEEEEEVHEEEEETMVVYPTRKNERPNIRIDPGILKVPKSLTRYG